MSGGGVITANPKVLYMIINVIIIKKQEYGVYIPAV